ncbi:formylglycine-generating enzyme family protein [Trichocoleus sp. FACHB-262]|uniref:formylglycine-generating enzyme family protein n=1 Tax=Trichocoleus sp. FACHB-262 TaxID=2692869 RepID=UPI001688AA52|nr:formylglycine-generating enzyme family protein [Trichocoleus sp. FACHB-262]MBD2122357.1 formylglycine-generating enzyme family protein [Trichocoleus sp. FACHB-262]
MAELVIRRERKQARYFTEKLGEAVGLDMILIPAGSFWMGSPTNEPYHCDHEGPQHETNVSTFFLGRYPVTQAQWRFVAELPSISQELDPEPSEFKGEERPVEQVSWYDTVEFCTRLAAHTSRPYRLPSEAEWEYACRAGTTTPFCFGKTLTTDLANYNGNYTYDDGPTGEARQETTPVNHFGIANAFGLCDMLGNVYEWCADHWHRGYKGTPTDGSAWLSENENSSRIARGGSRSSPPENCRSASHSSFPPDEGSSIIGFRVVCSASRAL